MYGILSTGAAAPRHSRCFEVCGVRFIQCNARFGYRAAARTLRRHGGYRCIFPENFSAQSLFASCGILPVPTKALLYAKAAEYCLYLRRRRGLTETVALCGDSAGAELAGVTDALAPYVRHIALGPMVGQRELCEHCFYERGLALECLTGEQLARAETLLLFAPPVGFTPENPLVLPLYPPAELSLAIGEERERCLPDFVPRFPLLAALYNAGALSAEEIFPNKDKIEANTP